MPPETEDHLNDGKSRRGVSVLLDGDSALHKHTSQEVFQLADADKNGNINYDEFHKLHQVIGAKSKRDDEVKIMLKQREASTTRKLKLVGFLSIMLTLINFFMLYLVVCKYAPEHQRIWLPYANSALQHRI
jgi:hypothetical protein